MIASWIVKRMARSAFEKFSADDLDVDAVMAGMTDDCTYEHSSELGVEGIRKGKKAIAEWFQGWKKEFPKRKMVLKNICFSAWPLSPTNVWMIDWSITETNREGTEFKYDGVMVLHVKNFKMVHGSDYISFKGLPQLSTLIKPTGKAQSA
jgi:ketosteroid isomerase-like protein